MFLALGSSNLREAFPRKPGGKLELSYAVQVSSDTRTAVRGTGFVDEEWGQNGVALLGGRKVYANVCTLETAFLKIIENGEHWKQHF